MISALASRSMSVADATDASRRLAASAANVVLFFMLFSVVLFFMVFSLCRCGVFGRARFAPDAIDHMLTVRSESTVRYVETSMIFMLFSEIMGLGHVPGRNCGQKERHLTFSQK